AFAGVVRDPFGRVDDLHFLARADAHGQPVRGAVPAAGHARHRVTHADEVGEYRRGNERLLDVQRPAAAAPLAGAPGVGPVVATPQQVGRGRLVQLRRGLVEVAEGGVEHPPAVLVAGRADPCGVDLAAVVDEPTAVLV